MATGKKMKTNIPVLDLLLGVSELSENAQKSPESMLIRGAPGSGKTTLALQILSTFLTTPLETGIVKCGIFLSLEVEPLKAWNSIIGRLSPEIKIKIEGEPEAVFLPGEPRKNEPPTHWALKNEKLQYRLHLLGSKWLDHNLAFSSNPDATLQTIKEKFGKVSDLSREGHRGLVVVDSINVLASMLGKKIGKSDRQFIGDLWNVMETQLMVHPSDPTKRPCNLILIGEHSAGETVTQSSSLSESFLCDIEILLNAEPIAGQVNIPANLLGPAGYAYERRQQATPLSLDPQSVEIRSFCRVLKSRFSANQFRRCAYNIEPSRGIHFLESYPGDGAVLLFHENAKQKEVWEHFLIRDVPLQFPALRHTLFDPPSVQRTFATQRRFNQLHQKTDLLLASFDTHWINWYWQLGQRSHLRSLLETVFPGSNGVNQADTKLQPIDPKFRSRLLCALDYLVTIGLSEFTRQVQGDNQPLNQFLDRQRSRVIKVLDQFFEPGQAGDQIGTYLEFLSKSADELCNGKIGLLQPIEQKQLRLFGERLSDIIKELDKNPEVSVHHTRYQDSAHCLSVPYNANVSFLVCNKRLLDDRVRSMDTASADYEEGLNLLLERQHGALKIFVEEQCKYSASRKPAQEWKHIREGRWPKEDLPARRAGDDGELLKKLKEQPTCCWEGLILLCLKGKFPIENQEPAQKPAQIVIETKTFESYLSSFLEIFWGMGGHLAIDQRYHIEDVFETERKLFQAFFLLSEMFRLKVIGKYSSVDPKRMAEQHSKGVEWIFARHWYSTLVDLLTSAKTSDAGRDEPAWTWVETGMELVIEPLPYSEFASQMQVSSLSPVSTWGEWHLAVLNGSENKNLAVELINDFMSSSAICDRAFRGAAVPTVEAFYEFYHDVPCLQIPERTDIGMPTMTYKQLRDKIFSVARSRKTIFDYQHCMREIHSVLAHVQHHPRMDARTLALEVLRMIDRIRRLQDQEMMIH